MSNFLFSIPGFRSGRKFSWLWVASGCIVLGSSVFFSWQHFYPAQISGNSLFRVYLPDFCQLVRKF